MAKRFSIWRILKWAFLGLLALLAIGVALNWNMIMRFRTGGLKVYETTPPTLPANITRPAILVFSKTNGFRHDEPIRDANALFAKIASEKGWGHYQTENGAVFSPELLSKFDAVVFNNTSGDNFNDAQKAAFKSWLDQGGGFVGIHASGGDFGYLWDWHPKTLIGAQFTGHPMNPQFQDARVVIEDANHPATKGLPAELKRKDEWYAFDKSVRGLPGFRVLATLDEDSYPNKKMNITFSSKDLAMGKDHPIVWTHCIGKGRIFYSAMGHLKEAYAEPAYIQMLTGATIWALKLEGDDCGEKAKPVESKTP